ncbi:hypothetical protein SBADM41S_06559 [Streptomyces badius]
MRQPPHRIAHHLHIGHPLGHHAPDPVHQGPQPHRLRRRLAPYRAQRGRRRHDRRQVLEPRRPPRLPFPGRSLRREAGPLADREQPDPGRPAPLVRARRQQRPPRRDRPPAERLGRVHQQRHPGLGAERGDLGHRLLGAHLVVGRLETGQRGVRPQRRAVGRRVHRPEPVHRHLGARTARRLVGRRRMEHRRVFDRRVGQMAADTPTARKSPGNSRVHRRGPGRGEDQLVGAAPDGLRGRLPGRVQEQPGPPPLPVQTGGIGPALVERGKQGLACDGVQGGGGGGIEVGHPATLARTRRHLAGGRSSRTVEWASDGVRRPTFHPKGVSGGALGTLPARPQIASSRVWSA